MNFRLFITYIADHFVVVAGSTLALFFTTCMILLIRSIGTKSENESPDGAIDVTAIEGAMQRVLATQPQLSIVPRVLGADGEKSEGKTDATSQAQLLQDLQTLVKSRDTQIEKLSKEVAEARAFKTPPEGVAVPGAAKDAVSGNLGEELNIYKAKIEELQARLAEYEIIEDDIADLSMFKEENARLKEEVNTLKAGGAVPAASALAEAKSAESAPVSALGVDAKASASEDQVAELLAAAAAVPVPAPVAAEAPADPLAEATNSEKMLSEVESLAAAPEAAETTEAVDSALEDSLDTEKLLAEVDSLKGAQQSGENTDDLAANFKKAAEG